jgi:uncharacterized protein
MSSIKKWRGLGTLITTAVAGASRAIEKVQRRTAERPFNVLEQIPPLSAPARGIHAIHDATLATVHSTIRLVNRAVDATLQTVLSLSHRSQSMTEEQIVEVVRNAKTVAVYGMQDESRADAPAFTVPQALLRRGYQILPVNPNIKSSLGLSAYAKVADLPTRVDILDVFRRSDAIPALADELIALPAHQRPVTIWLQSGITHPDAERRLGDAGYQVVSDRCLSVYAARFRR